jgi:hypothetical protein
MGVGRSAATAAKIAASLRDPVAFVFVGDCGDQRITRPADYPAVDIFEVSDNTAVSQRCSNGIPTRRSLTPLQLGARPGAKSLMSAPAIVDLNMVTISSSPVLAPDLRQDDWLEDVVRWIKAQRGGVGPLR